MARLVFEKTGKAVWISHLDLMRLFQRAFKRAGLNLKHTQGYNPRPSVSIALPLSVGVQSFCELLDFDLEGDVPTDTEIRNRLNQTLVEGVRVVQVYGSGRRLKDLTHLSCTVTMEYDSGVTDNAVADIQSLFSRDSLLVEKKSKNGPVEQDIIPMIKSFSAVQTNENVIALSALICCQNPSMNPIQMCAAIERYLPELTPSHAVCCRRELYDQNMEIFR